MQQNFCRAKIRQFSCSIAIVFLLKLPCLGLAAGHMDHGTVGNDWGIPGSLLIFPDLTVYGRFDQGPNHTLASSEVIPAVNLFYTADYGRFRFLGEWLLNTKTHNMERLQLGLHLGESSLWLGRFHSPIGYWNMQYHHAAILQTTINRPGIMAFETAGGIIPNHLTGFLFEGIHEFDQAGLYYTLGVGAGPDLDNGLSAFNIFEPGGSHRPGVSMRLGYQPISYGADEIGVSAAYTELPGDGLFFRQVKQAIATVYGNWQFGDFHLLSEAFYVNNWFDFAQGGSQAKDFVSAYGQVAWDFQPGWTVYGRVEGTLRSHDDPYLALFPKYVENRVLGGIRYNLNRNMSFKVEGSEDHLKNDHFGQLMFQWSAVFP